jgi:hypothetical protein
MITQKEIEEGIVDDLHRKQRNEERDDLKRVGGPYAPHLGITRGFKVYPRYLQL